MFLRLKHGKFEVQKTPSRGQWGDSQDDAGRIYRNTNESALHVDLVPTPYYGRNPNLVRTRGSYESLEGDDNEVNAVWPVRTDARREPRLSGRRRCARTARSPTSRRSCAPLVYRGDRLPADVYGNVFVAEPAAQPRQPHRRERRRHDAAGRRRRTSGPSSSRRPTSGSGRCTSPTRPTARCTSSTCTAASSSTAASSPSTCATRSSRNGLEQPIGLRPHLPHRPRRRRRRDRRAGDVDGVVGAARRRRCRIRTAGGATPRSGCWSSATTASVVPALTKLAARAPDARTRLHALWTLDGMDSARRRRTVTGRSATRRATSGPRRCGCRSAGSSTGDAVDAARRCWHSRPITDWSVRRQLAATLGAMQGATGRAVVAGLLESRRRRSDRRGRGAQRRWPGAKPRCWIGWSRGAERDAGARTASVAVLAATIIRGQGRCRGAARVRGDRGSRAAEWQRSALMAGAESGVLGTALPGSGGGRGRGAGAAAQAPCPTCPGGAQRAGWSVGISRWRPRRGRRRRLPAGDADGATRASRSTLSREPALTRVVGRRWRSLDNVPRPCSNGSAGRASRGWPPTRPRR